MGVVTRGFRGRGSRDPALPPGQYRTDDFPVLSAGPTPVIAPERWALRITNPDGVRRDLTWPQFRALPAERLTADLHCVTKWSKFDTRWRGVPIDALLDGVDLAGARYALIGSYGGYTTNLPLDDLLGGKAWVAFEYDGKPLAAEHGGPARLLVPHLYLWKSAKWINSIELRRTDAPGFWERLGYHEYGDPWREQRYAGDS